ncbi:MAG: DegT/DnrJ/EryC1/StrS family aminotransferase [Synergistales bacterium]|nr:DegT/DnrJ/EryC1/StrS family aminotransferase [Synergistales bacterium]
MREIPLSSGQISDGDIQAVLAVLRSGRVALGPEIAAFEQAVAETVGVRHAVACSSGTAALHVTLEALGVGPGDVVLTTPFSFISSSNVILMTGAAPLFGDIDPETLVPSPETLRQTIEGVRQGAVTLPGEDAPLAPERLRGMLLVDVFGMPAPLAEYERIATEYGLFFVEDSCEALGTRAFGRMCGAFGDAGAFAFYPNKQITTGEGGMIVTDRDDIAATVRSLINQGRDDSGAWLAHVRLGYNYRIDEMSAALGRSQIGRLDAIVDRRAAVAERYGRRLASIPGVTPPAPGDWCDRMSWFVYVVRLDEGIDRDAVMEALQARGVACKPYFTPIPYQPFYAERFGFAEGDFPGLEAVCASVLALPFYTDLSDEEIDYVTDSLHEALHGAAG